MKKLSLVCMIFLIIISLSVSAQAGYVFKQGNFNGGDYNLKYKEFNDGLLYWKIFNGKGGKYDIGLIRVFLPHIIMDFKFLTYKFVKADINVFIFIYPISYLITS